MEKISTTFLQSKRWRNKGLITEWLTLAFGLLLLLAFIGIWFLSEKKAIVNRVNENLVLQAQRVASSLERQLNSIHYGHINIKNELEEGLATQTDRTPFIYKRLNAFTQILPLAQDIKLINAQGQLEAASDNAPTHLSQAEENLLQESLNEPPKNIFYLLKESNSPGHLQLFFANKLTTPNKEFYGLFITRLSNDHLAVLLNEVFIAADTRVGIVNSEGLILAAAENNFNLLGKRLISYNTTLKKHLDLGAETSLFETDVNSTGERRLVIMYNFLPNQPQLNENLTIVISRNVETLLAGLHRLTAKLLVFYIFLATLSWAALFFVQRKRKDAYKQIQQAQDKLLISNEELEKANAKLTRQSHQLELLAFQDGLTGIANRRSLDDNLDEAWQACLTAKQPLAFIMLDIDFFKKYNDHYGHQQGDKCLRQIAAVLAETFVWPTGKLARFGGEEFACFMPNASLAVAVEFAEKLRLAIAVLNLPHAKSEAAPHVTLSLGVACLEPNGKNGLAELIKTADLALYKAKQNGRNQVAS